MRRLLLLPVAVAALALAGSASGAETKTVQIARSGFSPANLTVTVGDTVTFHNADTQNHQIVADDGSFASPVLSPDGTYSVSFSKVAAAVRYHDGLRPSLSGTVKVNGPPAQVNLTANEPTILFGHSTTLNCEVSSKAASEQVTLNQQVAGDKTVAQADQTQTAANGTCNFTVSPTRQTMYTAQWKTTTSPPLTVFVRPLVGFGHSGRIYTAKVTSDVSYGGHFVFIQRRNAFGTWVNAKKVFLSSNGSRARFTVKVPKGRSQLRVWLPTSEAGAGYVESVSRTLIARR